MDEDDLVLYEAPIDTATEILLKEFPLMGVNSAWALATAIIKGLGEEDFLIKPERCAYANGPRTVICENDAPIGKTWCYVHGD